MPRSSSVLDGGRFGDEAFRLQNLLQYIPFSRITQPNADPNYRIQTGQSQLLQVAEALSRLIRDADRSMNSNSPRTAHLDRFLQDNVHGKEVKSDFVRKNKDFSAGPVWEEALNRYLVDITYPGQSRKRKRFRS